MWGSLILAIFLLVLAMINAAPVKEELQVSLGLVIASLVFVVIAITTAGISLFSYFWKKRIRR
jgi:uncharacterized integral membrane protein